MNNLLLALPILGHILVGFYFAFFGLWNIYHWTPFLEVMAKKGIPHAYLLLALGITWQFTLGILIMFGIFVKLSALLLIPFVLVSLFIFHDFWNSTGETRRLNLTIFVTNLTIILGALLQLM